MKTLSKFSLIILMASLLSIPLFSLAKAYVTPNIFSDGFENGVAPYDWTAGSPIIVTSPVHSGSNSLLVYQPFSYVSKSVSSSTLFFDQWVYIDALPANYGADGFLTVFGPNGEFVMLYLQQWAGVYDLGIGMNPSHQMQWLGYNFNLQANTWYEVQFEYVQGVQGGFTVWLNPQSNPDPVITYTADTSAYALATAEFGTNWAYSVGCMYLDDIGISTLPISGGVQPTPSASPTPTPTPTCTPPQKQTNTTYTLKLSATPTTVTMIPQNITLKLSLSQITRTKQKWSLLHWLIITKSTPVKDATISFYSCDKNGTQLQLLGTAVTNKNGIAIFPYTITYSASDYWFVAQYTSTDGQDHTCKT